MKTSEVYEGLVDNKLYNTKLHKGKPRGYYDPSPVEVFFTKIGQEIYKYTDNNQHKTLMSDEDWITHCDTANKCVRFGTLYGPKALEDFKPEELTVVRAFLRMKDKWI
tara:strand:- start:784 stop:1107 length:324 start_codon:yes stop_codon:yes gene_type:complete